MALQSIQNLSAPVKTRLGSLETWQDTIGHIESELYNSEIYQQMMVRLQAKLGELAGEAQNLIKNINREAIRIALQQLASQQLNTGATPIKMQAVPLADLPDSDPPPRNSPTNTKPEQVHRAPSQASKAARKDLQAERIQQRLNYLRHLGQSFKQIRETQGVSIDQLQALTRIPVHQLRALEVGKIEALPEIVYVRGFIRQIGNALGLEGDRLATAIPEVDPQEGLLPSWSQPSLQPTLYLRPAHLYVGYTALIAGAVGGLAWVSHPTTPLPPTAPQDTSTSATTLSTNQAQLRQIKGKTVTTQSVAPPESTLLPGQ